MLAAEQMVIDENKRIRVQGRAQGRAEGRAQGRRIGITIGEKNIIKSLLKSNMQPSEISERTGISLNKILRLAK